MRTATLTVSAGAPTAGQRPAVLTLARQETLRLARHPVFVVATLLFLLVAATTPFSEYANATYDVAGNGFESETNLDWTVAPAFFLGLGGLIAMNRITTSTRSAGDLVTAVPVGESQRTIALCLACLLPAAVALVGAAYVFTFWMVDPPVQSVNWRDFATTPNLVALMATSVLAALGGPLLGVLVGRWWHWPTAGGVTAVLLIAWSVLTIWPGSHPVGTLNHMAAPYTLIAANTDGETETWLLGGSWAWRVVYLSGLCALAALGAYAHGTEGPARRRVARVVLLVAAATVAALLLSVFLGPEGHVGYWDPVWRR
jgi:hypothetical protein